MPPYVEAALFLFCGFVMGAGVTVFIMNNSIREFWTRPEKLPDRLLTRMDNNLGLSDAQHEAAARIIHEHFEAFNDIRSRFYPEIQSELDRMRNDIAAILSDEQRALWEEKFDNLREKWQPGPLLPGQMNRQDARN